MWQDIALRYKNETQVIAYELLNEPIANNYNELILINPLLEPLFKKITAAIREVDTQHILVLGGS